MKLIVQIPCHNEAEYLPATLAAIPRQVPGVETVEVLVLDDGSDDETTSVALAHGADAVIRFPRQQGLARVFKAGIDAAIRAGADVIVNTDGDNQYDGAEIPRLVAPILSGQADMVVGDRDPGTLAHFSLAKRLLQRLGSWLMRQLSGTTVADSTSGFRAYHRDAAMRINVVNDFTYTLETLIQAGSRRLRIIDVPIQARHTARKSRLAPTTLHYLKNAGGTMARAYAMYEPMKVFFYVAALFLIGASAIGIRFLIFYLGPTAGAGNVQSLILAAILAIVGFQLLSLGLIADLLAANRKLLEEQLYRLRRRDSRELAVAGVAGLPDVVTPSEGAGA
jgi:glycosyltransferase involved in cell wall biosynthesis